MAAPSSREIIQASQVPSIPEALQAVLTATSSPNTTASQLEKLVLRDAGLAMQLLKMVNSSFYGLPNRVKSVGQAIVLLGFPTIKNITSGLVMLETFGRMDKLDKGALASAWGHSLAVSRIVGLLAAQLKPGGKPIDPKRRDDLCIAALVHDVGHLVLSRHFEARYAALTRDMVFPLPDAEIQAVGIDHARLGGDLLKEWKFPDPVPALVAAHHGAEADPLLVAADLLAEGMAYNKAFAARPETEAPEELVAALALCGTSWSWVQERNDAWASACRTAQAEAEGLAS